MNKGSEFKLEEIKALITKGKTNGLLTTEEITETLSEIDLNKEQMENIYSVVEDLGIEIVDEEDVNIDARIQTKKTEKNIIKRKLD
ncbi:MAG TPA: hypothetical protein DCP02_04500, partial [Actinobacteria bacterium]|nr:hypothetical protein [Actinomycetota bacterium]